MSCTRSRFSVFFLTVPLLAGGSLLASSLVNPAFAESAVPAAESSVAAPAAENTAVAPDNSAMNKRDRSGETVTAMDQSNRPEDMNLTRDIRRAIMDDSSLSMEAKNIKIITLNGTVTLRGPVKTAQEKATILAMATQIARDTKINNQLEIEGDTNASR